MSDFPILFLSVVFILLMGGTEHFELLFLSQNQCHLFEKHTITKSIQENDLTGICVMKRSIDLQLWIMVRDGWY